MTQCGAIRSNGERCRAQALPSRSQCFAHDPENRDRATAARRRGGTSRSSAARAAKRMAPSQEQVLKFVEAGLAGVYKGTLTPQQGSDRVPIGGVGAAARARGVDARGRGVEGTARRNRHAGQGLVMSTLRTEIAALKRRMRSLPGGDACHMCGGPHLRTWVDVLRAYHGDGLVCGCDPCRACEGWREHLVWMAAEAKAWQSD